MKTRLLLAAAAAASATAAAACTAPPDSDVVTIPWVPASAQLAAFGSCDDALTGIQDAAIAAFSAWENEELARGGVIEDFAVEQEAADSAGSSAQTAGDDAFSETNNAVAGVDEPDLVKTDGAFIYSVAAGALRVADTRTAELVAERAFSDETWDHRLFLGDDELLLMYTQDVRTGDDYHSEFHVDRLDPDSLETLDSFAMEGTMVDARLVDGELRLAVGATPRLEPVWELLWDGGDVDQDRVEEALRDTELADWLPEYQVNGASHEVDCAQIAHPERFSGSSVSVLALPADGDWTDADPQTVMVDGETVHGTAESLYLAHYDYAWGEEEPNAETEIYRFTFEGGEARLAGDAAAPGTLLNQYSLSEYDGHLRVATTEAATGGGCGPWAECLWSGAAENDGEPSKSTVTVFQVGADSLEQTGSVTDLGVDERIYAVRFMGHTGYVVTFRQTDPLYTLDLSDPANPVVTGELKITGYSGYLHPVGPGRLLGVGQEATEEGRTTGLQVSLFDTSDAEAAVLDQYHREGADSAVQWDPHAFLYWEDAAIAVLPVNEWNAEEPETGALVLAIGDDTLTEAAWISHDAGTASRDYDYYGPEILRTIVIGDQLWTVSHAGLQANALGGDYAQAAWISW